MKTRMFLILASVIILFGFTACDGGGSSGGGGTKSASTSSASSASISGSAVKGPLSGAEVSLFYFDGNGNLDEIVSSESPILTDDSGAFSFPVDGQDLMGITSPLIVKATGGSMYGESVPNLVLEGVIGDPQPLTYGQVALTCHLSAASSVAAALLKNRAAAIGTAPTLDDTKTYMDLVENQLNVSLSDDPADSGTPIGMFNHAIDRNLNLESATSANYPAVSELIAYLAANLSSSSEKLDTTMDDPDDPGMDTDAGFAPFGGTLAAIVGSDPGGFIFMTLTSDTAYIENTGTDTAAITAVFMDAAGRPYQALEDVSLGLVEGPGLLTSAGLSYASGSVMGELTSDMTGDTGDIKIRAVCPLPNGSQGTLEIIVQASDFGSDVDGDGLSDGMEGQGWDIAVDELGYGELAATDLLRHRHVYSDPNLSDTDGDGLTDAEEYVIRTDPCSADTDGDGLTDYEEWNIWMTSPTSADTDGDARGPDHDAMPNAALFDGNELAQYGTSPTLADTDGDGRTDCEEIDHPARSPLISDLPKLEMEIVDAVDVRLDVTYAEEAGETFEYGREIMKSTTTSTSATSEHSINAGVSVGMETTATATAGLNPSASVSTTMSYEMSFDYGHKWSTTNTSSQTAQQSHSEYVTDSRTRTETAATGSMSAGIKLKNPSDITYTISKLGIGVRHWEMKWDEDQGQMIRRFQTVATLIPPLGSGFTLAPGEETPVLQVAAEDLNPDRVKELLRRPDSLYTEAAYFELENAEHLNFDFLKEVNASRTASIIIDPGKSNAEEYRVATNVDRGFGGTYPGVSLGEVLNDILEIDYTTIACQKIYPAEETNKRILFSLRGLETHLANPEKGFWAMVHESPHPISGMHDFNEIPVRAGDRVLLIYVRDSDGDGLTDLGEQHRGTFTAGEDYDGDGLTDKAEVHEGWQVEWTDAYGTTNVYQVLSDPTNADQDRDGLNDAEEKAKGTDPANPDTDRDGIPDGTDPHPNTQAKTLYVDQNANGANDGSSWKNAYTNLQNALQEARTGYSTSTGDDDVAEIWVAQGVYTPSDDDPDISFELVDTVGVYGGFRGTETKRSQRETDPRINGTELSGELPGSDKNSYTIVSVEHPGIWIEREEGKGILDGFLIRGGDNIHDPASGGLTPPGGFPGTPGGMVVEKAWTLRNLFFFENHNILDGGALYLDPVENDAVTISRCIFTQNHADDNGGAVFMAGSGVVSITDCYFLGNTAGTEGGAIKSSKSWGVLLLKNTEITENEAVSGYGGGASIDANHTKIMNCRFTENHALKYGGGLCVWDGEIQISGSVFNKNNTGGYGDDNYDQGGAIYITGSRLHMVNTTVIKNHTDQCPSEKDSTEYKPDSSIGGGICSPEHGNTSLHIENCIFWGNNDAYRDSYLSNQIFGNRDLWKIHTSAIQNYDAFYSTTINGFGNISLCIPGEDGCNPYINLRSGALEAGSPCIDAGNKFVDFEPLTSGFQPLPDIDLAGEPRMVDGDDDGWSDVDMGAYEYQP